MCFAQGPKRSDTSEARTMTPGNWHIHSSVIRDSPVRSCRPQPYQHPGWTHVSGNCKQTALYQTTIKPVLSGNSNTDKTKILMTNGSLMKVESIAECSKEHSAILLISIKRLSFLKTYFLPFF